MRFVEGLLHFFTPGHTNNHRAKALHFSSIGIYIAALLIFQVFLTSLSAVNPDVLGFASNINVSDLLTRTNEKRVAAGLAPLSLNEQLSQAAAGKAADMFAGQYWAHVSPSGKKPWDFISGAGYHYTFAGENLARDFGDSTAVVDAWMNSPTHKDNLLNSRYHDIGFAVVNGKFGNNETTLVVQMFGTRSGSTSSVAAPLQAPEPSPASPLPKPVAVEEKVGLGEELATVSPYPKTGLILPATPQLSDEQGKKIDVWGLTKKVSSLLVVVLIGILVIDSALVYKRKIIRFSGHNIAHLLFLVALLAALNLIGRGMVL